MKPDRTATKTPSLKGGTTLAPQIEIIRNEHAFSHPACISLGLSTPDR
jgi:hypothetical protein